MRIACPHCGLATCANSPIWVTRRPSVPIRKRRTQSIASSPTSICATIRPARTASSGTTAPAARLGSSSSATRARTRSPPSAPARPAHERGRVLPFRRATAASSQRRIDRSVAARARTFRRPGDRRLRRRYAGLGVAGERRSVWSAAASNITARAAFSPPGRKSRTRSSNCAAAHAANRTRARLRSSCSTGSKPRARTAGRRCASTFCRSIRCWRRSSRRASTTRPSCGRPRSGSACTSPSSAAPPAWVAPLQSLTRTTTSRLTRSATCLIIGAGAAGLAAAQVAARSSARVILCEQDFIAGGRLLADDREIGGVPGSAWAEAIVAELRGLPNVRLMPRTCVFGVYDGGVYGALERVADHLPVPPRTSRGSGCGGSSPNAPFWRAAPSSDRWSSRATTGRA